MKWMRMSAMRLCEELLVKLFVRELSEGCQGSDIKCGVINAELLN